MFRFHRQASAYDLGRLQVLMCADCNRVFWQSRTAALNGSVARLRRMIGVKDPHKSD